MSEHGTHARYVSGCRCEACRAGHSAYVSRWEMKRRYPDVYGPTSTKVDATETREHVAALMLAGVGKRTIARRAGVSLSGLEKIRSGRSRRIWPETARKLLALTTSDAAGGAYVDASETWRLIDELVAGGVRRYRIAGALGNKSPALQLGRRQVTKAHADRIQELHDGLWWHSAKFRLACSCVVDEGARERARLAKRAERARGVVAEA